MKEVNYTDLYLKLPIPICIGITVFFIDIQIAIGIIPDDLMGKITSLKVLQTLSKIYFFQAIM